MTELILEEIIKEADEHEVKRNIIEQQAEEQIQTIIEDIAKYAANKLRENGYKIDIEPRHNTFIDAIKSDGVKTNILIQIGKSVFTQPYPIKEGDITINNIHFKNAKVNVRSIHGVTINIDPKEQDRYTLDALKQYHVMGYGYRIGNIEVFT